MLTLCSLASTTRTTMCWKWSLNLAPVFARYPCTLAFDIVVFLLYFCNWKMTVSRLFP